MPADTTTLTPLQRALLALQDMQGKLNALERLRSEPIAIIGIGCRFPGGANDADSFWRLLRDGTDAVTEVPADRWDAAAYSDPDPAAPGKMVTRAGGFLAQVDAFDSSFFRIAPREAASMDPQQRLLLEVSWEALEDAGQAAERLRGSKTGVFVGISTTDYAHRSAATDLSVIDAYSGTGNAFSVAAGRISYVFGLQGPSVALDTACSSSLVAVHLACQSLRLRESNLALAGGVNLMLSPLASVVMSKLGALSPDGRCRTFDASANGYVRAEGCGVLVLKRLSDALADGDRILALVRGSAVNQDGPSGGLTVPSGPAQQRVVRDALAAAGIAPARVSYVEAHGTGTPLGDPIEAEALGQVLGEGRPKDQPYFIGSIKTNFGHAEAAAGVAGILKVVLALVHRQIPAHLHFRQINPHIPLEALPMRIPTETVAWEPIGATRVAGVSSFGFGGTNAHVVLEEAPAVASPPVSLERPAHVLAVSAKTRTALKQQAARFARHLAEHPDLRFADVCHTSVRRTHFDHRGAIVASSAEGAREALAALASGQPAPGLVQEPAGRAPRPPKVAFLFTGQGSQYAGMGKTLYEAHPVFRDALDRCAEILRPKARAPLLALLFGDGQGARALDETENTQPALFAFEYALLELWRSWGVVPEAVMGHSVGELVAACAAGVFSLEAGLTLVAERGRLMQSLANDGAMAAVRADPERVARAIEPYAARVSVAAINGPSQLVVSGDAAAVRRVGAELENDGVKVTPLRVSHAFHSPLMDPIVLPFERAAREVAMGEPRIALVSNVTGCVAGAEVRTAAYWARHVREPVRFEDGMHALAALGVDAFVEIGPQPTLLAMGASCVRHESAAWLASMRKGQDAWSALLQALCALHVRGAAVDWRAFDAPYARRRASLPAYAWERERHWFDSPVDARGRDAPARDADAGGIARTLERLVQGGALSEQARAAVPEVIAALEATARRGRPQSFMYRVVWKQFALDAATSDVRGRWVLLADQGGVATALQRALEERGASCVLVGREDAEAHVAAALESEEPTRGVLCAFGLDEGGETPTLAALKVLARASGPRCWLLTRGAVAVDPGDRVDASQGAYSGLARSFSLECPRAWGGQVDLPPPGAEDDGLNGLVLLLGGASGEDHVALRAGGAFGARLVRREPPPPAARARLELSGTVLVTGGLGGLGRELARWLALRGARSLLLTGRRGIETPRAKGLVEELEARGVRVAVARADSSDGAAMRAALLDVPPDRPLCAVFHLAGVEDATPIAELTPARLREVLAPKRDGAEVLRELTNDVPLEAFVCFSSIAGVWGAGRQAAYAAANSYLDVWAHAERARGRRALAISWGPWLGEGMASPEALSQLEKRGVRGLDRRLALEALDAALHADEPHVVVADVDWALFRRAYEAWRPRPLLDELEAPTPAAERVTGVERGAFARELGALPTAMRAERLQRWVTDQCAHVLGHTAAVAIDPRRGFSDLGMDSLMAVELRSRVEQGLGVKIPATVTFDHPSVVALCNYLLDPLGLSPTPRTRAEEASPRAPDPRLEDLDDESLLAVLDEELSLAKRGNAR